MEYVDIYSGREGPAGQLSNLTFNPFIMDNISFGSTEGFLQGLRVQDPVKQKEIFAMHGIAAKKTGYSNPIKNDTLYYKGKPFNRHSEKYKELLSKAFHCCFAQNDKYQLALHLCRGKTLRHSIGKSDPFDTILTEEEFVGTLNYIRYKYAKFLEQKYGQATSLG